MVKAKHTADAPASGSNKVVRYNLTADFVRAAKWDPSGFKTQILWAKKPRGIGLRLTPKGAKLLTVRAWAHRQRREYVVSLGPVDRFVDFKTACRAALEEIGRLRKLAVNELPLQFEERARAKAAKSAPPPTDATPPAFTLLDALNRYFEDFESRVGRDRKARTLEDYRASVHRIPADFLAQAVHTISRRQAKDLYKKLGETAAKGSKFVATNRLFALMRAAVTHSIENGDAPSNWWNPFRGWKRVTEVAREQVLEPQEFSRFLAEVGKVENVYVRNYLKLLCSTGQRPGELRRLEWRYVRLDGGRPTMKITCSKNHEDIEVALTPSDGVCLRELAAARLVGNGYVFPLTSRAVQPGDKPRQMTAPHEVFRRLLKSADVPDITLHDIKATALTNLARAGFNTETLMLQGNHKTASTTQRYIRLAKDDALRDRLRDARAKIIADAELAAVANDTDNVSAIADARAARHSA